MLESSRGVDLFLFRDLQDVILVFRNDFYIEELLCVSALCFLSRTIRPEKWSSTHSDFIVIVFSATSTHVLQVCFQVAESSLHSAVISSSGREASPGAGGPTQGGHVGAAGSAAVRGEVDVRGVCGGDGEFRGGHESAGGPPRLEPGERRGGRGDGPNSGQTAGPVEPQTQIRKTPGGRCG